MTIPPKVCCAQNTNVVVECDDIKTGDSQTASMLAGKTDRESKVIHVQRVIETMELDVATDCKDTKIERRGITEIEVFKKPKAVKKRKVQGVKTASTKRKAKMKNENSKSTLENKAKSGTNKLKFSIEESIEKLTDAIAALEPKDPAEARLEATNIVKWCSEKRESIIKILNRLSSNLKNTAEFYLARTKADEFEDYDFNLCGMSRHTASTEAYFSDMMYCFEDLKASIIILNAKTWPEPSVTSMIRFGQVFVFENCRTWFIPLPRFHFFFIIQSNQNVNLAGFFSKIYY
uniref:Uncharacterized protein n=1 Tax=Bracon brevicornis TaxID=1563983 RepID=A0A6V7ILJ3_9HYME